MGHNNPIRRVTDIDKNDFMGNETMILICGHNKREAWYIVGMASAILGHSQCLVLYLYTTT